MSLITLAPATAQQSQLFSVTACVEQFDRDHGRMVREDYLFACERKGGYVQRIKAWVEANCTIGSVSPNLIELYCPEWETAADDRIAAIDDQF
ncbi:hypothetical protein C1752_10483 [Acaryochloris thomasi RCC1774]|uniref:Uncharacterized protein n=1 Tax=Acaryochloris thomasi RCC1774 TaxID=1764569 RepID=A0A2W1J896_9CYAN|nr:hypothetical protein [Acaryochloris thomasi]PZD70633.1 hypothetical protein C1752_10483 [Acaryochloris thomasi RCC1774]